jgi:RNA polymerase sigma-70 factor, ECF subfamily
MPRLPAQLSVRFTEALSPARAEWARTVSGNLEELLAALLSRGQRAWPALSIEPEGWMAFLAARTEKEDPVDAPLAFANAEDLYLSYACVVGAPGAMRAFEGEHFTNLRSHLAQLSPTRDFLKDVEQTLRAKLFVAEDGGEMGIAAYAGRGPLGAWFRVTSLNTALKLRRAELKDLPYEPEPAAPPLQTDPEHALIRARTKAELAETLRYVLEQAPAEERVLLRLHFLKGTTLEELARIFKVDRATIVRRIARARRAVLQEAQRRMVERLKLSPSELSSTFRISRSDWTLSLEVALGAEKAESANS